MKFYIAQLNPTVGALTKNADKIINAILDAKAKNCDLIIFSEMVLQGYTPEDLLYEPAFIEASMHELERITKSTVGITAIVGCARKNSDAGKAFRNSAAVIQNGAVIGFQDKCLLPTYDVFDEARYMEPAQSEKIWDIAGLSVGITVCEDIWKTGDPECAKLYTIDPLDSFEGKKLDLLVNISASPYALGKIEKRKQVAKRIANRLNCPVVIVNQVGAQDGVIYDGSSLYVDANGSVLIQAPAFSESYVSSDERVQAPVMSEGNELFDALVMGVKDYFSKQGLRKALLGLSGGIDSAVVACILQKALGSDAVTALIMPSRFTPIESKQDALQLAKNLKISSVELSIEGPFQAYLQLLQSDTIGVVEENIQSRIRGMLLMALSNKEGSLVVNTGNKSELAMGYTTLYGDSCGAIGVLGDLLKYQVYEVARYINKNQEVIPSRILTRAPSAELRPNQKDTDSLPEYAILDTIVDEYVVAGIGPDDIASRHGFDEELVKKVCRTIHINEYKRRQAPFALRVSKKAFSCGRRVPIVHRFF